MSDSTPLNNGAQPARPKRRFLWWGIGGVLVLAVAVAAVIIAPRVIHAQRVATYTDLVAQINTEIVETDQLRHATVQTAVLYALQITEVEEFAPKLQTFADYSDHYFTDEDRESLAVAGASLADALATAELSESETGVADAAKKTIEDEGYMWQTPFINLAIDVTDQLIEEPVSELIEPVSDDGVTKELVEEAEIRLADERGQRAEAEQAHDEVEGRASALITAVAATLDPLTSSAQTTPEQAKVVLGMYPRANTEAVELLQKSAQTAVDSVTAELFMYEDDVPVPVIGDIPEDTATFPVNDAWRAIIVATHLEGFSGAVTAAWITDAGGVEEALGFNPYLPFG